MKTAAILIAGALILAAGLRSEDPAHPCCDSTPRRPAGKAVDLDAYATDELRAQFNEAGDRVRVVALLSPTCPACQKGQGVIQDVFEKFPGNDRMRGFVVWLPMLRADDERAAERYAGSFTDPRLRQVWDGKRASGALFAKTLGLNRDAWDVYLLYAPGVKWTGSAPPKPTFWMHQLRADSGADQRVCLDPAVLMGKVEELMRAQAKGGS